MAEYRIDYPGFGCWDGNKPGDTGFGAFIGRLLMTSNEMIFLSGGKFRIDVLDSVYNSTAKLTSNDRYNQGSIVIPYNGIAKIATGVMTFMGMKEDGVKDDYFCIHVLSNTGDKCYSFRLLTNHYNKADSESIIYKCTRMLQLKVKNGEIDIPAITAKIEPVSKTQRVLTKEEKAFESSKKEVKDKWEGLKKMYGFK